jgi:hypothetical protein
MTKVGGLVPAAKVHWWKEVDLVVGTSIDDALTLDSE